ncbi:MAG: hypothetical protein HS100_20645 [Anaerolineales bacterium]|nr:hypothetical protein [Anaerolineales bacterium]
MKNGVCPKCSSSEVYFIKYDYSNLRGSAAHALLDSFVFPKGPGMNFTLYICVDCGYTEHYVHDKKQLKQVAQKAEKISKD